MVLAYFPYHITVNEKMTIGQLKNTVDDKVNVTRHFFCFFFTTFLISL